MEVVLGSEVRFYEGNTIDPQRCVIAMTDAPLHSSLTDALPSAGFVAFPESANFSDRIIKWSAIGEKMYLEERSLMNSNVCSSVSLDFMRTGIIPGTSFEMFEKENILSLVVPTQSTVHRFSIPLSGREMGPSILSRLNDNLLLDNYHTSHPFLSEGRPVRASVAQHYQKTTIAYCDAEGRVSVVTLLENGQKHEEVILNNAGFFDRLMGENVELSSDVCALRSLKNVDLQKHTSRLNILSDIIISVTKNGWLRAWNAENRRACAKAIDLNARNFFMSAKPEDSDDDEEYKNQLKDVTYSIKGKIIDGSYFLTVSALKISTGSTAIHLIKLQKDVFTYLGSFDKYAFVGQVDKLIDFVTLEIDSSSSQDEEMDGAINREFILTGLWLNGKCGSSKDYVIRRARFGLNLNENLLTKHTEWFEVGPFENSPNDVADDVELDDTEESDWKNEKSLEELRDSVFNLDKRHFNTVWRAAQIQCSGYKQLVLRSGNWSALAKYIEGFLDSPQFVQQYQLKTSSKLRLNKNSGDITNEAQKKFWQDLVNACEQFEQGPRKPYALANIQSGTDVAITAVIHETYFTIISDYNEDLYQSLLSKSEGLTSQSFLCVELLGLLQAVRPTALKLINSLKKQKSSGGRRSCEVSLDASQKRQAKLFGSKINDLTTKFVELAGGAKEKVFSPPYQCVFGGSLTQSMVGGRMKLGIESRLLLAATLKLLKGSMEFTEIDVKLDGLLEDYVLLSNLADLNIVRDCAKVSLITWLPSDPEGLAMVRNEGGFAKDEATIKYDFTTYINQTVQAGIRALLPASETFVLPKKLVATRNFKILMKVLHLLSENSGPEMKPALAFFQGVAYCGTDVPIRAMEQFESAHQQLLEGNRSVRKAVLALVPMSVIPPDGQDPVDSITSAEFYFTTIKFLQEYKHSDQVVRVAARSIDQLPADSPTMAKIASTLYSHLTSKMEWTNAFKLVVKTSGTDKTPQIRELLSLMIYKGAWEQLASMSYGRYEDVVEDFLRDAAARQSPQEPRHLYELLFSYYVSRQEYRLAAVSMYAFAKHIENAEVMTRELLKKKRAALAAVLNMQSVVGMKPAELQSLCDTFRHVQMTGALQHARQYFLFLEIRVLQCARDHGL